MDSIGIISHPSIGNEIPQFIHSYYDYITIQSGAMDQLILSIKASDDLILYSAEFISDINYGGWANSVTPVIITKGNSEFIYNLGNTSGKFYLSINDNAFQIKYKSDSDDAGYSYNIAVILFSIRRS